MRPVPAPPPRKGQGPFSKRDTHDAPFRLAQGGEVRVPTMTRTGPFAYYAEAGFQALELPYKGKSVSMVVLLPSAPDGLPALEDALTEQTLATWLAGLRIDNVTVWLPRLAMRSKVKLTPVLQALGIEAAFLPLVADLSGIGGAPGDLFVQSVDHEAFVAVHERGAEAAAVTVVRTGVTSAEPVPEEFRADRPFLFLLRHRSTGAILFLGRVSNPTK